MDAVTWFDAHEGTGAWLAAFATAAAVWAAVYQSAAGLRFERRAQRAVLRTLMALTNEARNSVAELEGRFEKLSAGGADENEVASAVHTFGAMANSGILIDLASLAEELKFDRIGGRGAIAALAHVRAHVVPKIRTLDKWQPNLRWAALNWLEMDLGFAAEKLRFALNAEHGSWLMRKLSYNPDLRRYD